MNNSFPDNLSNSTLELAPKTIFGFYSVGVTAFFLTPMLIFNIVLAVVIALEKSIVGTLRLLLVNIITAGQIVNVGLIMTFLSIIIISGCRCPELQPSDLACRAMWWVLASGGAARVMYMATFAIAVEVLVRYGARNVKMNVAIVAVVVAWAIVLLPNAVIFLPDVMQVQFHGNDTCTPHGTGYKTLIYAFGYIAVYGLLGFTVSVLYPIASVWYIRHNTISDDITVIKAMMKFAVFLILGNAINFIGIAVPLLFATFTYSGKKWYYLEKIFIYLEGIFILLSLVPTPILILVYFRPVRQKMQRILCCVCVKKKEQSKSKTSKTATSSADKAHSPEENKKLLSQD